MKTVSWRILTTQFPKSFIERAYGVWTGGVGIHEGKNAERTHYRAQCGAMLRLEFLGCNF